MYQIESIGPVIAAHRKELGMTQEQLAVRLHITAQAVSKWESGAGYPDLAMLPRIAEALSVSPNVLLGGEAEAPAQEPTPEAAPEPSAVQSVRSEWNGIDSVEVSDGYPCRFVLQAGDGGPTVVEAQGSAGFLSMLEVTEAGNTLRILVRSISGSVREWGSNRVTVRCGFSQGECLDVNITGCSDVLAEPSFREANLHITGSGTIDGTSVAQCDARVTGSGKVRLRESTERLVAAVAGSGEIVCQTAKNLTAILSGSGGITCKDAHGTADVRISGTGKVHLGGTVDSLHVDVSGIGDLFANRLTAGEADLEGNGMGSIAVGRVVGRCSERVGRTLNCTVSHRGTDDPADAD